MKINVFFKNGKSLEKAGQKATYYEALTLAKAKLG